MSQNSRIFLALGSNIGDRIAQLGKAILLLSQHAEIEVKELSSIYETEPVGYVDQDRFYNMVVEIKTNLTPRALLALCLQIEQQMGRERTILNGPRTIDIDVILYGNEVIQEEDLDIPHPRMHQRAFVLVPLAEVGGDASTPN